MSCDLKARGLRFVGPTICYAYMQATGMINDHTIDCFRWEELQAGGRQGRAGTAGMRGRSRDESR